MLKNRNDYKINLFIHFWNPENYKSKWLIVMSAEVKLVKIAFIAFILLEYFRRRPHQ